MIPSAYTQRLRALAGLGRWPEDRDDSPWYPAVRLFRQERPGEWGPVVERVSDALTRLVSRREPGTGRQ